MAVLTELPEKAVIATYKGIIDFYLWKGIPVARKYPVWKLKERSPAVKEAGQVFAYVMKEVPNLPEFIQEAYRQQVAGTPFRWIDLLVRAYISGIKY